MKNIGIKIAYQQDGKQIIVFLSPEEWRISFPSASADKKETAEQSVEETHPYFWGV